MRWFTLFFVLSLINHAAGAQPVAAVFRDGLVAPSALAENAAAIAENAGYKVQFIDVPDLTKSSTFYSSSGIGLLILPHGQTLPVDAIPTVSDFIKGGGNVLALGAPLWDTPLAWFKDRWVSRADYDKALASIVPTNSTVPFHSAGAWTYSSDQATTETKLEGVDTGKGATWHVTAPNVKSWDTFSSPPLHAPFTNDQTLTFFMAKGTAHTKILLLEWREHDGSRWIATVELSPEWKRFVLPPSEFKAWPALEPGNSRVFQPSNAVSVSFGVAVSHGNAPGNHEYWISGLATATNPYGDFQPPGHVDVHLEGLAPSYISYPLTSPLNITSSFDIFGKLTELSHGGGGGGPPRAGARGGF